MEGGGVRTEIESRIKMSEATGRRQAIGWSAGFNGQEKRKGRLDNNGGMGADAGRQEQVRSRGVYWMRKGQPFTDTRPRSASSPPSCRNQGSGGNGGKVGSISAMNPRRRTAGGRKEGRNLKKRASEQATWKQAVGQ